MSKDLFLDMRAEEMASLTNMPITKKEANRAGKTLVETALNNGNVGVYDLMAQVCRLKEIINAADAELRANLPTIVHTHQGVSFAPVNGGESINFNEDEVWLKIKSDLAHREALLKVAQKSNIPFYDEEGVEVPKVGSTPRKSSITIKF